MGVFGVMRGITIGYIWEFEHNLINDTTYTNLILKGYETT